MSRGEDIAIKRLAELQDELGLKDKKIQDLEKEIENYKTFSESMLETITLYKETIRSLTTKDYIHTNGCPFHK